MILHTINKSPHTTSIVKDLNQFLAETDLILLIEDGVLGLKHADLVKLNKSCSGIYALLPDIKARGIESHIPEFVTSVDYAGFVELTLRCQSVRNW